jgi:hypothetical protein
MQRLYIKAGFHAEVRNYCMIAMIAFIKNKYKTSSYRAGMVFA